MSAARSWLISEIERSITDRTLVERPNPDYIRKQIRDIDAQIKALSARRDQMVNPDYIRKQLRDIDAQIKASSARRDQMVTSFEKEELLEDNMLVSDEDTDSASGSAVALRIQGPGSIYIYDTMDQVDSGKIESYMDDLKRKYKFPDSAIRNLYIDYEIVPARSLDDAFDAIRKLDKRHAHSIRINLEDFA